MNPVNVMLTPEELAFVLRDCGAAAVFTSAEQAPTVLELTRDLPDLQMVVACGAADGAADGAEVTASVGPAALDALSGDDVWLSWNPENATILND